MTTKPEGLKPWPFCGGKSHEDPGLASGDFAVCCTSCDTGTTLYDDPREAITAWNRRSPVGGQGIEKLRDRYRSQAKFADHEAAAYFRDFVRELDALIALAQGVSSSGREEHSSSSSSLPAHVADATATETLVTSGKEGR